MPQWEPQDSEIDRLLGGKPDLGVSEREAMLEHVLRRVAPERPSLLTWPRILSAAAVGIAALCAVVLVYPFMGLKPDYTPRGEALRPTLTVSCLEAGAVAPCRPQSKLAIQVDGSAYKAVGVVAETPDGTTLWLYPGPNDRTFDLRQLAQGAALPEALVLGDAGEYVLHAVFTQAPVTRDEVRKMLLKPEAESGAVVSKKVLVQ